MAVRALRNPPPPAGARKGSRLMVVIVLGLVAVFALTTLRAQREIISRVLSRESNSAPPLQQPPADDNSDAGASPYAPTDAPLVTPVPPATPRVIRKRGARPPTDSPDTPVAPLSPPPRPLRPRNTPPSTMLAPSDPPEETLPPVAEDDGSEDSDFDRPVVQPKWNGATVKYSLKAPAGAPEVEEDQPDHPDKPTPPAITKVPSEVMAEIQQYEWAQKVAAAVERAAAKPDAPNVIPVMIVPLFKEGPEFERMRVSIDTPVRLFAFVWNSNSPDVAHRLDILKKIPFGISVSHYPHNVGFSGAVNAGIVAGEANVIALGRDLRKDWYFIVNADSQFPTGNLIQFATQVNNVKSTHGMIYGPRQDHFAFAITRTAVDKVGYFDEVFFPGYMEDIDYHWRTRLAGLPQLITRIRFIHQKGGSVNRKKPGATAYEKMLTNCGRGWEYGWAKWGKYGPQHIEKDYPPSGFKTPFNIPDFPLSMWAIDKGYRRCVRTGKGTYFVKSSTCWYNGATLKSMIPENVQLPQYLLAPGPSLGVEMLRPTRRTARPHIRPPTKQP